MQGRPEVWGGAEYTCNRVGDHYFDQMLLSGHAERLTDYQCFRNLGLRTLRLGVLWEQHQLDPEWKGSDARMDYVRAVGIRPLVGLVHHGSGPRHTSLLDAEFPAQLAEYAGSVAERYPWVDAYTPVNEPNTTARFSGLYGFWYPHHRCRASYLRALLQQVKATVLSMQAIRRVRPDAQLIQTDDAGRTWSTEELSATCDLLNQRRWLQMDLLCGSVGPAHPLFDYLCSAGIPASELLWFQDNPCPPQIVGINYYVTSDRFLDHRLHLHPHIAPSDEGDFLDFEAVRVREEGIAGFESLLTEAWDRFAIPTAITEVHLGSTSDEQIRWAVEAWNGALRARQTGVPCVAVTFWALLGSFFWNTLVTRHDGLYEPGVFDLSAGDLRPTALAGLIAQLTRGEQPCHPALSCRGWWHHPSRLLDAVPVEVLAGMP